VKIDMRIAALPVALLRVVLGLGGIVSPDGGMAVRRLCFATPGLFYAAVVMPAGASYSLHLSGGVRYFLMANDHSVSPAAATIYCCPSSS
jgi:hypothetical protein